jgi:DNA-binding NtrC family response regulator
LKSNPHDFELASSTKTGIDLLGKLPFDLVISDMYRQKNPKTGIELIKQVKEKHPQLPVIVFSSENGVKRHGKEAKESGAIEATSKTEVLLQCIEEALKSKPADAKRA